MPCRDFSRTAPTLPVPFVVDFGVRGLPPVPVPSASHEDESSRSPETRRNAHAESSLSFGAEKVARKDGGSALNRTLGRSFVAGSKLRLPPLSEGHEDGEKTQGGGGGGGGVVRVHRTRPTNSRFNRTVYSFQIMSTCLSRFLNADASATESNELSRRPTYARYVDILTDIRRIYILEDFSTS